MSTSTYRSRRRKLMAEINVVPYIDVMLVLLVIFMITAPLLTQGVKVNLPQAAARPVETDNRDTLIVTVTRYGKYYLDDRLISPAQLRTKVATVLRIRPRTPVMISGDGRAAYDEVVRAMALLQSAGAESVGLLTQTPVGAEGAGPGR